MLRSVLAALALIGVASAPAWAEPAPDAAPAPAEAQAASPPLEPGQERVKVRCRNEVITGTRFAKRTCRRLDDLARAEAAAIEALNRASRMTVPVDTSGRPR